MLLLVCLFNFKEHKLRHKEVPFPFLPSESADREFDNDSEVDSDFEELLDEPAPKSLPEEEKVDSTGIIALYLGSIKAKLTSEMSGNSWPTCYTQGSFWIHPPAPIFALVKQVNPAPLYYPSVFVWLPHLFKLGTVLTCSNKECQHYHSTHHPITFKGYNDKPIARRVVALDRVYYVLTVRFHCKKQNDSGCGQSWNMYNPLILDQLDRGLADCFPAFFTARSGIDKTLMTLIRAGIAHRLSASAWSKILRELHVRDHDLRELQYLYAIHREKKITKNLNIAEQSYEPFSAFDDKSKYAGFYPSRWYINNVYMDYMQHIRPILDQCIAALRAYIIKWDHSFKVPKYLMKLNGVMVFVALFTIVNEFEQIRFQAFVPTKSLSHIHAALEGISQSLQAHGLPQPVLGFTDNVASDAATFMQYLPSLAAGVSPVELSEFSTLPQLILPDGVTWHLCQGYREIDIACGNILELVTDEDDDNKLVDIGFDMEWEFTTGIGASGPQKTALIQIAVNDVVYMLYVHPLKELPPSLGLLLCSKSYLKIGKQITADFQKLARDFPQLELPEKRKAGYTTTLDIGTLAAKKNVVHNASASLSAIVAATLGLYLSKEARVSSWSTPNYSDAQINYAALDAYVLLMLVNKLRTFQTDNQPLSSLTPLGQHVSLHVRHHVVAYGTIIAQPTHFEDPNGVKINVSTTKTRALIHIDKVLAPACVMPHHKASLSELQNGRESFEAVVSISSLKTRSPDAAVIPMPASMEPDRVTQPPELISPPVDTQSADSSATNAEENPDIDIENLDSSESEMDTDDLYCRDFIDRIEDPAEQQFYQQMLGTVPSRILADVFHEIDKVCRTISRKHTLRRHFARAFSDTMLVPDLGDKTAVEAVLAAKGVTWDQARSKSPGWLWRRVRRYIPQKDVLHHILSEFFTAWADVKCSVTNLPLFSAETRQKVQGVLNDVKKGWVSDPVGITVFTVEGIDKNSLTLYHCIRGTNSVEGAVHNPLRRNFAALNASPELADSLAADWRHRHNVDCGALHKDNIKYSGHYDPWLDDDIFRLKADIEWKTPPTVSVHRVIQDTSPLSFAPTQEQFGITGIPMTLRAKNDFLGSVASVEGEVQKVYPAKLHLSALKTKRDNVYDYLAHAQRTKFAVAPVHTQQEFDLFKAAMLPGGNFFSVQGKPNFDQMAVWWSSQANGKTVFYKLKEHLESHHKVWEGLRKGQESLAESREQRQPHRKRIRAKTHVSHVLPAATRDNPGVVPNSQVPPPLPDDLSAMSAEFTSGFEETSNSDLPGDSTRMSYMNSEPDNLAPEIPAPLPVSISFPSSLNLSQPVLWQPPLISTAGPSEMNFISYIDSSETKPKRRRKCAVCVEAGRDGYGCPGESGRKRCKF
ncbi:hypothetical protein C8F04DRAFT_979056 [Mycena alexandri]|uniref:3'-5' exonuclease domain-containing protein n=1 Tax=Mycena alexandri TaxID=1745969 RepID=A0AAD6RY34_9AGAR|nr:hypothetical protein C8F04DRAFT_979056 [Mycena alexandri]